jgi:hypothetical protein
MDELARRYVTLGLRIARHVPDYVDGYSGPPELREAVQAEVPAPPQELHAEAMALHDRADELRGADAELERRRRWLLGQLTAMSATCRFLAGEEIAYVDLVEALYDVDPTPVAEDELLAAHGSLEAVLPGDGSLRDRLERHQEATRVPQDLVIAVLGSFADVLRRRTAEDLWLPDGESIEVVAAHDAPWGAYATYLGGLRTRIEVNVDLPQTLAGLAYLAAHEGYPGHHADRATKDARLPFGESRMNCLFTPEAAMSEGMADIGREVVMSDLELGAELQAVARRFGLPMSAGLAERSVVVSRARDVLRSASVNVALKLFSEGQPVHDVRAWLADVALMSEQRIDHELRTLRDPLWATTPFTYHLAPTLIRPWLETQGQTRGYARLLSEQLSPAALRAEVGEPPALFPGDLV